jgi:hypothetical protein
MCCIVSAGQRWSQRFSNSYQGGKNALGIQKAIDKYLEEQNVIKQLSDRMLKKAKCQKNVK